MLEEAEFDLGRELEGLFDMFSVQCINHNVETVLDLSGTTCFIVGKELISTETLGTLAVILFFS